MPIVEITFSMPLRSAAARLPTSVRVVVHQRDLDHRVRADGVGAQPERHHHVVHVADARPSAAPRRSAGAGWSRRPRPSARAAPGPRRPAPGAGRGSGGRPRRRCGRRAPAARAPPRDGGRGLLLEPLDRALGVLGLQAGDVEHLGPAAEGLPQVLEQEGLVLVGDLAVGLVGQRRQLVVAAEQHREGDLDRVDASRPTSCERRARARARRGRRSARPRARGRSPGW